MTGKPTTLFVADQFDFSKRLPTKSWTEDPDDAFLTGFLSKDKTPPAAAERAPPPHKPKP